MKSRDKTVLVSGIKGIEEDAVRRAEDMLRSAIEE
jgi:hypothetical protein